MKNTEELGKKINQLRLKNDLSLRDLAERSGVSFSFINSIEKNRFNGSRETIVSIANALKGADKNELLLLAGFSPDEELIGEDNLLFDPDVQFIARAKKDMHPNKFRKMMELAKKAKEMVEGDDD
jgi:transcriptional regulator with XRE-family HTH domain